MIDDPGCPICDGADWDVIGSRTYARAATDGLSDFLRDRYRVVFEVWQAGVSDFTIESRVCRACGFVLFAPRPSAEDVDRKYRFLQSIGSNRPLTPYDSQRERRRSARLLEIVTPHLASMAGADVLDFGGADGRLMQAFAARGARCHVIDYCDTPIPGVVRLGATARDLPAGDTYDAIVCSHVLEHVADPLATVRTLAERLKPDGVFYAEVPMEVWRRAPLPKEPVTHINFFTPSSLTYLMARAGLAAVTSGLAAYPHPDGATALVIGCIARPANRLIHPPAPGVGLGETKRFLKPGLSLMARRAMMIPGVMLREAAQKLQRTTRRPAKAG
jgi:SAM-dependent methyltransferase